MFVYLFCFAVRALGVQDDPTIVTDIIPLPHQRTCEMRLFLGSERNLFNRESLTRHGITFACGLSPKLREFWPQPLFGSYKFDLNDLGGAVDFVTGQVMLQNHTPASPANVLLVGLTGQDDEGAVLAVALLHSSGMSLDDANRLVDARAPAIQRSQAGQDALAAFAARRASAGVPAPAPVHAVTHVPAPAAQAGASAVRPAAGASGRVACDAQLANRSWEGPSADEHAGELVRMACGARHRVCERCVRAYFSVKANREYCGCPVPSCTFGNSEELLTPEVVALCPEALEQFAANSGEIASRDMVRSMQNESFRENFPMAKISERLYLGGEGDAMDREALVRAGITHVLNVSRQAKNYFPDAFTYHNIPILDEPGVQLPLDEGVSLISRLIVSGETVLVHCLEGRSRSASMIVAYLMATLKIDADAALQHIKSKRRIAQPNEGFMRQLVAYRSAPGL